MPIRTFMVPVHRVNETERQAALDACRIDEAPNPSFDAIVGEAAKAFAVPFALVSIVDRGGRPWFKARVDLELGSTPRRISFCGHAINSDVVFAVPVRPSQHRTAAGDQA